MKSIESYIENYNNIAVDRGDGLDQSKFVNKTNENENIQINLASGEPEGNQSCLLSSSEAFIISIDTDILSNTTVDSTIIIKKDNHHSSWLRTYWFSVTIFSGLLITLMIILTTILIYT